MFVGILVIQGCATNPDQQIPDPDWLTDYLASASTEAQQLCRPPIGTFYIYGQSSKQSLQHLSLADVLFEDKLAGFPVSAIQISQVPDSDNLQLRGVLDGVPLQQSTQIVANDAKCSQKWFLKVSTGAVDARLRTEAVLYTGALIFPLSETNHIHLASADDQSLILHVKSVAWVLGALSIPIKFEEEYWMRFEQDFAGHTADKNESEN